jgi:hypothetical protein
MLLRISPGIIEIKSDEKIKNKLMKQKLIFLFILLSTGLWAQTEFESYNWNTLPAKNQADTINSVEGSVILLERRITEVYANKQKDLEEIFVYHKKIKVETHQAIDRQNKIYVPIKDVIEILKIEARFIAPNGKITVLKKESIKELENPENKGNFKTFAIEGVEVGGQIEYFYILRKNFNPHGGNYIQDEVPKGDVTVIFAYPSKLEYLSKSYNGFPGFQLTTGENDKSYLKAEAGYIPALPEEEYAYYKASLMRYEYTLAYNNYSTALRIYSWNNACSNIYSNLIPLKKNEESAVRSWIRKIDIPKTDLATKVRHIENRIKSEISISEDLKQEMDLDDVIKFKQSNKRNVVRLFLAIFQFENIGVELVVTGDMQSHPFDPDFNCFNYLDNYMIYIPAIDAYLAPDDPEYRMGVIPSNYQGGFGLFLHPVSYNEKLSTMAYELKQIPFASNLSNADTMYHEISIDVDQAQLRAKSYRAYYGDVARNFQSFWHLVDNDKKNELVALIFNMGSENTTIEKYNVINDSPEDIGLNPMIWNLDITANSLVENAGNDIIVKIGETISTQAELYQATTRKLPIKISVLHDYYRKIVFNIPAGYTVSNLSDLNMHVEMLTNGKTGCIFTSEAKIINNQLIIISREYYCDPAYPVSRYEEFRNVINAAADFNKKTIVLKKV